MIRWFHRRRHDGRGRAERGRPAAVHQVGWGRLAIKFYLWLLVALTVSTAAASGAMWLLADRDWEGRFEGWARAGVRAARDVTQNLLDAGHTPAEVEALLAPVGVGGRFAITIMGADGSRLATVAPPPGQDEGAIPPPTAEQIGLVIRDGRFLDHDSWARGPGWRQRHRHTFLAGLPLRLADGAAGAFFVTVQPRWGFGEGQPYRFLAGLGTVLIVLWALCWPLAFHLARPLRRMADTADALGRGDFAARIELKRRDELGVLARSFNRMAENLQRLVEGHKQLLADISHELRSPLARLRVALELARQDAGRKAGASLDTVERQADEMDTLIGELLAYSRLEAAPYALRPEALTAREVVDAVVAPLADEGRTRKVTLITADVGAHVAFSADRRLLTRALGNVAANGLAHSPEGGTLTVCAGTEGGQVWFVVEDEGPGVASDMLERIFEPFFRVEAGRERGSGGVGLGLAIARRCMESMGGGATAEPNSGGKGLRVRLWLPVTPPSQG